MQDADRLGQRENAASAVAFQVCGEDSGRNRTISGRYSG
jgi:hypothetical protein